MKKSEIFKSNINKELAEIKELIEKAAVTCQVAKDDIKEGETVDIMTVLNSIGTALYNAKEKIDVDIHFLMNS